jgi:hypothetical protein
MVKKIGFILPEDEDTPKNVPLFLRNDELSKLEYEVEKLLRKIKFSDSQEQIVQLLTVNVYQNKIIILLLKKLTDITKTTK